MNMVQVSTMPKYKRMMAFSNNFGQIVREMSMNQVSLKARSEQQLTRSSLAKLLELMALGES
jgi:hypothetical protein